MSKLIKVTFEYDDKTEVLSENAQEWLDMINSICVFLHNRGQNPFDKAQFNWESTEKTKPITPIELNKNDLLENFQGY